MPRVVWTSNFPADAAFDDPHLAFLRPPAFQPHLQRHMDYGPDSQSHTAFQPSVASQRTMDYVPPPDTGRHQLQGSTMPELDAKMDSFRKH